MKFLPSQLAYLISERELRTNLSSLLRYIAFLAALVTLYAVLFVLPVKAQLGELAGIEVQQCRARARRRRGDPGRRRRSLGAETLFALIRHRETVILGEGVALFTRAGRA